MRQIFARRVGRIAFGVVLLFGVARLARAGWSGSLSLDHPRDFAAVRIILVTWAAAAIAGGLARLIAARVRWSCSPGAMFAESVMVPTAGVALLLPITLHMPIVLLAGSSETFDIWVMASLWITGVAHLVFATLCVIRARQLVARRPAITPRKIFLATLITSCIPFVVLYAIPPIFVAITLAPFMPMLHAMGRMIGREQLELETVAGALPRAIARAG